MRVPWISNVSPSMTLACPVRSSVSAMDGDPRIIAVAASTAPVLNRFGIAAPRPPRSIAEGRQPVLLVAIENLVAGLARYPEFPAHIRRGLPVQQTGDKAKALLHNRTRFPRHPHLPLAKKRKV